MTAGAVEPSDYLTAQSHSSTFGSNRPHDENKGEGKDKAAARKWFRKAKWDYGEVPVLRFDRLND